MERCYLLLGGNLGDVLANFDRALELITAQIGLVKSKSSLYKSEPWGYESQNWYYNMAIEINTSDSALNLLDKTQEIEREIGRTTKTTTHYADRPIDIDILDFNLLIHQSDRLTLPHPRLHLRRFALTPLFEIAPTYIHPQLQSTIAQMLALVRDEAKIEKL